VGENFGGFISEKIILVDKTLATAPEHEI